MIKLKKNENRGKNSVCVNYQITNRSPICFCFFNNHINYSIMVKHNLLEIIRRVLN